MSIRKEGWVVRGTVRESGAIYIPVMSREEGINCIEKWAGHKLSDDFLVRDTCLNEKKGYLMLSYEVYFPCAKCECAISTQDYYLNDGLCSDCYEEKYTEEG